MKNKLILAGLGIICFCVNLVVNRSLEYALINSSLLILGVWGFGQQSNYIYFWGLAIMPILTWNYSSVIPGVAVLIFEAAMIFGVKSRGSIRNIVFVFACAAFLSAILLTTGILKIVNLKSADYDRSQLTLTQTESVNLLKETTLTFQTDLWSRGIPFVRSKIIYNLTISMFNRFYRNLTDFLYLPNFYQTLMLANLYLIILGMGDLIKRQVRAETVFTFVIFGLFLVVTGVALHAEKNACLYPLIPVWIFLSELGSHKSRPSIFFLLMVVQILLMGWK